MCGKVIQLKPEKSKSVKDYKLWHFIAAACILCAFEHTKKKKARKNRA